MARREVGNPKDVSHTLLTQSRWLRQLTKIVKYGGLHLLNKLCFDVFRD